LSSVELQGTLTGNDKGSQDKIGVFRPLKTRILFCVRSVHHLPSKERGNK